MSGFGDPSCALGITDRVGEVCQSQDVLVEAQRTNTEGHDDGVAGDVLETAGDFDVFDFDTVFSHLDELPAGQELRAAFFEFRDDVHLVLDPGAGGQFFGHFDDDDVVAFVRQELGGLETGHAGTDDGDLLAFELDVAAQDLVRRVDVREVVARDLRGDRRAAGRVEDGVGLQRFDVLDGGYNWVNHVRQVYGADVWYDENGYSAILSNPLFKEALQMKLDCETEGIWFSYPDARQTGNTGVDPFMQHRANAYVTCNVWRFIANTTDYPIDFKVGFAPYPTREAGQINYCEGPTVYGFMTIVNTCEHPDEAWEFVKYFATEGNYHILKAGHMGMYADADKDQVVEYVFGSMEQAEKLIDVESFKRVVLNFGGLTYVDTIIGMGGNTKVSAYEQEILAGNMTIDDGMAELEQIINQAIQEKMDELE